MMNDIKAKTRAALADGTIETDGRIVLAPEAYAPHFTADDLSTLGRVPVGDVQCIDNLEFLYWLCERVGGDANVTSGILGSGRRAQELVKEIARAVA